MEHKTETIKSLLKLRLIVKSLAYKSLILPNVTPIHRSIQAI